MQNLSVYINSLAAVSPQPTNIGPEVGAGCLPASAVGYDSAVIKVVEPEYKRVISPVRLRRMSRVLKMGLFASSAALKCSSSRPVGVVVGTGYGCHNDLVTFLRSYSQTDNLLSPTPFVNGGHNSLSGNIAIVNHMNGFNMTLLQDFTSFEAALRVAALRVGLKNEALLVGSVDETCQFVYDIGSQMGFFRSGCANTLRLVSEPSAGTVLGEGAAFFSLSSDGGGAVARLRGVDFRKRSGQLTSEDWIAAFLQKCGVGFNDVDFLLLGKNGDLASDLGYGAVEKLFCSARKGVFKHLCGEYCTASAFAMWLGCQMLSSGSVPGYVIDGSSVSGPVGDRPLRRLLIYNRGFYNTEAAILLSTAD